MDRVVSVSLFGAADMQSRYQEYLPCAIRAHHALFQGWKYRIYHDHLIDRGPYYKALRAMQERGLVELAFVSADAPIEKMMLWRLIPLWDDKVELFIIRDVDMVACYRERRAVEEWIRSGMAFHAISDLANHHNWPSLNGMIGLRVKECRELLDVGPKRRSDNIEKFFSRAGWTQEQWAASFRVNGPSGVNPKHRVSQLTSNNQFFVFMQVWPLVQKRAFGHRLRGSASCDGAISKQEVAPFANETLGVSPAVRQGSDALIPFIGASRTHAPEMNLGAILSFYKRHGDPNIERAIAECEAA